MNAPVYPYVAAAVFLVLVFGCISVLLFWVVLRKHHRIVKAAAALGLLPSVFFAVSGLFVLMAVLLEEPYVSPAQKFNALTPAEHLLDAEKLIEGGYTFSASRHLAAIPSDSPESLKALSLRTLLEKKEVELKKEQLESKLLNAQEFQEWWKQKQETESKQSQEIPKAAKKYFPRAGDHVLVVATSTVAEDNPAWDAMIDALDARDKGGLEDLILSGKVFMVQEGDRVRIYRDKGLTSPTRIRVMSGKSAGRFGWIPSEYVGRP